MSCVAGWDRLAAEIQGQYDVDLWQLKKAMSKSKLYKTLLIVCKL